MKLLRGMAGIVAALIAAAPAMAQNVGNNAGVWWNPAPGQPAAFTFLNPLTTVYGRIGFLRAIQQQSQIAFSPPLVVPGLVLTQPDAWGGMLGIGARLMPVLRYELQLGGNFNSRLHSEIFGAPVGYGRTASVQLLNNLYLDGAPFFGNGLWGLDPYVFGGIGVSWNIIGENVATGLPNTGYANTHVSFAWNVGAGVQWQAMRNLILDVAYRYLDAGRFQGNPTALTPATTTFTNRSHQIMFSVVVPVDGLIRGFGN